MRASNSSRQLIICCYYNYYIRQVECISELTVKCIKRKWGGYIISFCCCVNDHLKCCLVSNFLLVVTTVTCLSGIFIVHKHLFLHFSNLMYPLVSFTLLYWCMKKGVLSQDGPLLMVMRLLFQHNNYSEARIWCSVWREYDRQPWIWSNSRWFCQGNSTKRLSNCSISSHGRRGKTVWRILLYVYTQICVFVVHNRLPKQIFRMTHVPA